jgi:hypothetical protein
MESSLWILARIFGEPEQDNKASFAYLQKDLD